MTREPLSGNEFMTTIWLCFVFTHIPKPWRSIPFFRNCTLRLFCDTQARPACFSPVQSSYYMFLFVCFEPIKSKQKEYNCKISDMPVDDVSLTLTVNITGDYLSQWHSGLLERKSQWKHLGGGGGFKEKHNLVVLLQKKKRSISNWPDLLHSSFLKLEIVLLTHSWEDIPNSIYLYHNICSEVLRKRKLTLMLKNNLRGKQTFQQ